jgi:hypothetical protein
MNIPVYTPCRSCGEPYEGAFVIGAGSFDFVCTKCGMPHTGILAPNLTIGFQIWLKSWHELNKTKDPSMAVVLAATAIDCELSFLFSKWTRLETERREDFVTDEEIDEMLLKFRRIVDKLKEVTGLLVPGGVEHFVSTTAKWRDLLIPTTAPELDQESLIKSIEMKVFRPRNSILHRGQPADTAQGELSVKLAHVCLLILRDMDVEKGTALGL